MALSQKQHKELLDQTLQANVTFKSLEGVIPCRIIIDGNYYNVYIKNLSSAHFSNENVWRAQLPSDDKFAEMKESPIPFIFLGYDEENDVYATWNPHKVKQRLNEAKYVSFYSRLSAQKAAHDEDRFVRQELNNEGEVLIFPRTKLGSYLVNMQTYFADMSDYVAMGSKRRTEANNAYRELNNAKNVASYAKYLEEEGCEDVTLYCKWLKYLINQNEFSHHRKDFLACDTIYQYDAAVERFLKNKDIAELDTTAEGCMKDVLMTYVDFLKLKFAEEDDADDAEDTEQKDETEVEENDTDIEEQQDKTERVPTDYDALYYKNGKITKVANPEVLHMIETHLNTEYKAPIVAVNILKNYYAAKFELQMEFKDWMKLVQGIDWTTCYNAPVVQSKKKASRKKSHFLRVTFSDGRVLQHRNSARTFAKVIEECYPDLITEIGIMAAGVNIVSTELSDKYAGAQIPISGGFYVMTNLSTSAKRDVLEQIEKELELDYKAELIPIEEFEDSDAFVCDLPSASRKRIRITFPDGRVIQNTQVQQTLVDVVNFADPILVLDLNIKMSGNNIITNDQNKVQGENKWKAVEKGYYVNTGSSTADKHTQIKRINESLGLGLKIELI